MRDKSFDEPDYTAQVEARVLEEAGGQEVKAEEPTTLPLTFVVDCLYANRVGDATLYAVMHRKLFTFVHLWGRWLIFSGHHWDDDINNGRSRAAVEAVCEQYERILIESQEVLDKPKCELARTTRRRLNILRDKAGRENVLEMAATHIDEALAIKGDELDKQEYLLACPTGVINLTTGECQPGRPEQYILNACPTPWEGLDTPSPEFDKFLSTSFAGDKEMISFILRLLGYALLGNRDEHVWAIFHGPRGRNGKDTLMKIIFAVMGHKLAIKVPSAMLMQPTFQRSSSQPEPDKIALRGAKFAFINEGESGQRIATSLLKDLTGGSLITARGINDKHMTTWQQTHLLFFLTNEVPRMKSDDDAFWTRSLFVHWPIRFVDKPRAPDERKRDPRIFQKMAAEASGILARLVGGCLDYLENNLSPPEKVLAYTQKQRDEFDDIGQFLHECCIIEEPPVSGGDWKTKIPVAELLAVCNWWCKKSLGNVYPFKPKGFTQALERKGISSFKSNIMHYRGVRVKEEVISDYHDFLAAEDEKRR
jgi:putative DNA primase/helicase